jgi:hypothetical protein
LNEADPPRLETSAGRMTNSLARHADQRKRLRREKVVAVEGVQVGR